LDGFSASKFMLQMTNLAGGQWLARQRLDEVPPQMAPVVT
jgi:hypothetical protein